jgi:hypothetical protein
VLANTLFKGKVKFPSLQLAVMGTNDLYAYDDRQVDKEMSYTAPISPIVPVSDPFVLFNTVFGAGGGTGTATGSGPTPQQLIDKSVLDAVQADFMRLQTKLSSADWQLLAAASDGCARHRDSAHLRLQAELHRSVDARPRPRASTSPTPPRRSTGPRSPASPPSRARC